MNVKKIIASLKNILVIFTALFLVLLCLEIFSRNFIQKVPSKGFHFDINSLNWDENIKYYAFNKPSVSIHTNGLFKEDIFIDKNGFRVNSSKENIIDPKIIAIGDSQTFGHAISADDTWPSLLAKLTNFSVGNWGVFGYGVDHYDPLITKVPIKFQPDYVIIGMTDNDICSLTNKLSVSEYRERFLSFKNENHLQLLKKSPKHYFLYYTSIGKLFYGFYQNLFYRTSLGSWLRPMLRPRTVEEFNNDCTLTTIKWFKDKALFLKNHGIQMIVIRIPYPGRVVSLARGFTQKNVEQSIKLMKTHQEDSYYSFIDPIEILSEHYKNNDYKMSSLIVLEDGHNNLFTNQIFASLLKEKINELE